MATDFEYRHPQLGDLIGLSREKGSIVQFRGVPYASIPARFRQCELADFSAFNTLQCPTAGVSLKSHRPLSLTIFAFYCLHQNTHVKCRTYCLQPVLFQPPYWQGPMPVDYPTLKAAEQNEFSCLNLTITAPQAALGPGSLEKLPVLVFIHGGALAAQPSPSRAERYSTPPTSSIVASGGGSQSSSWQ